MPRTQVTIKLNGAPAIVAAANVEKVGDVPRLMRAAEGAVRTATKVFAGLRDHKVLSITVRAE